MGLMEHRPRCYQNLVTALGTLIPSVGQPVCVTASRFRFGRDGGHFSCRFNRWLLSDGFSLLDFLSHVLRLLLLIPGLTASHKAQHKDSHNKRQCHLDDLRAIGRGTEAVLWRV